MNILRPLVNEKSTNLMKTDFYTFEVSKDATKSQIERMIKDKFKVDVLAVKTINQKGKKRMQRSRRLYYTTAHVKKALVQLKKGQKIALFEQAMAAANEPEKEEVTVTTAEGEPVTKIKEKKSLLGRTKVKVEKKGVKSV